MSVSISIFHYNCHLFEGTAVSAYPKQTLEGKIRLSKIAQKIGELSSSNLLISLCEIWADANKKKLIKAWKGQYPLLEKNVWYDPTRKNLAKIESGLLFLSTAKILQVAFEPFNDLVGIDRMSQKGFYTLRLKLDGYDKDIYFIQTHAQAQLNDEKKKQSLIAIQKNIQQIVAKIKTLDGDLPMIVSGDLNINEIKKPYHQGVLSDEYMALHEQFNSLGLQDAFRVWNTKIKEMPGYTYAWRLLGLEPKDSALNPLIYKFAPHDIVNRIKQRIDYIWVSKHFTIEKGMICYEHYDYHSPKLGKSTPLSDHYPVLVSLKLD